MTSRKRVKRVKPGQQKSGFSHHGRDLPRAKRPAGKIEDFFGILAGKTKKVATIEEINEAAAAGWAGLSPTVEK
jgi:antitoxin PrlF